MRTNVSASGPAVVTFEGAPAVRLSPLRALRRSVLTTLLWEDSFYESGAEVAKRISALAQECDIRDVALLAVEAREQMRLRHAPLFLVRELARRKGAGPLVAATLPLVIQRPDELSEYLAIYWRDDKDAPLSAGSKRGLARAFRKFNEYSLAKYDRDGIVKLRDVLRLARPKPDGPDQSALWKRVVKRELATPDTWETVLSAGSDKKEAWTRLLAERKLGGLAFLRNLRNMKQAGVDETLVRAYFANDVFEKVLPFRFIAAAKHAPQLEDAIEPAMLRAAAALPSLQGKTALLIDVSGSMFGAKVSARSEIDRFEAAAALAILARETCEAVTILTFSEKAVLVAPRRGFALRDILSQSQAHGGTYGGKAVDYANAAGYDRIIALTDGQWHGDSPAPITPRAYMVNVAAYTNAVGGGQWQTIDGWSEHVLTYVAAAEAEQARD